jgi:hypothetical protein
MNQSTTLYEALRDADVHSGSHQQVGKLLGGSTCHQRADQPTPAPPGARAPGQICLPLMVMVDSRVDSDQWLSLADAASALGISEKTVRRRAKAGQIEARQTPGQHGLAWQVRLPTGIPTVDRVDSGVTQPTALLELVRMVAELQPKAEAAAMWQARAELLAERLEFTEGRLAALMAPQPPPDASGATESPEPPPEPAPPSEPFPVPLPPTPNERGWWKRLADVLGYGW